MFTGMPMPSFYKDILHRRYSRRDIMRGGAMALAVSGIPPLISRPVFAGKSRREISSLAFNEVARNRSITHALADGYTAGILLRWGDALLPGAPDFDPYNQTAGAQSKQFGFNNDYTAYFPLPRGSKGSAHGLLCVNHEYAIAHLMFPGIAAKDEKSQVTKEQVDIEMQVHGVSVMEILREDSRWKVKRGSLNRRVTAATPMRFSGPAAGNARLMTGDDPSGMRVLGTLGNCAGGVTPWGTMLTAEENFQSYFSGKTDDAREAGNHARYGVGGSVYYGWHRFYERFDVAKQPHEANRFGWIIEIDPYDPASIPVKHTAPGRFKHECATCALTPRGRLAVYSGDDEKFEYLYRYVSDAAFDASRGKHNSALLEAGTLYAAQFRDDGMMRWLPLVFGEGPLNASNGFSSQADVLIETRRAADLMGATKMDRPEDIEIDPRTGAVYCVMTHNENRGWDETDAANPRPHNVHGHILVLRPPNENGGASHDAREYSWEIFIAGGNPESAEDRAAYPGIPTHNGWLSCPDNIAFDPQGRLWIATDGQPDSIASNDGLYAVDIANREGPKLFFTGPRGCEVTGPSFTPDGKTLFVSIQHPGDEKGSNFDAPSTRWPDFDDTLPPRPSILAITKDDGGDVGG